MDFDEAAATWDSEKHLARARAVAEVIVSSWQGWRPRRLLDFGTGTGLVAFAIRDLLLGSGAADPVIIGHDISAKMRAAFDARAAELGARASSTDDLVEVRADAVVSSLAFHHLPDVRHSLDELYRACTAPGRIAVIELDVDGGAFHARHLADEENHGFDRAHLASLLCEAGFTGVQTTDAYAGVKAAADADQDDLPFTLFCVSGIKA